MMTELSIETLNEQIAALTGIPVEELSDAASLLDRLLHIEAELRSRLIGQDAAVDAIMQALQSRLLRESARRPVLNMMCVGPSGVGKTETALQIARICFGDSEAIVLLDGSEYHEKHSIARLIGAPPGYEGHDSGGYLTEAVRRRPRSVILFDEIEKAAPEVLNVLLQVMSAGRLTDGLGQTVDFRRTILVLTSNLGNTTTRIMPDSQTYEHQIREAVVDYMSPEFLGRLDAIVVYHHLSLANLEKITRIELSNLASEVKGISAFQASNEAIRHLAEEAYAPNSGAREIARVIRQRIEPAVGQLLSQVRLSSKRTIVVSIDYDHGEYIFREKQCV